MSSALFALSNANHPLAEKVVADANHTSRNLSVNKALPIRPGRTWNYALPASALCVVVYLWLPQMDLAGLAHARTIRDQQQAEAISAQETLTKTLKTIEQIAAEQPEPGATDLPQQDLLNQIAELTQQDLSDQKLRSEAAARLTEAREQLTQQALQKEQQLRPVENMLTRLDPGQPGPADKFASALRRGDMDTAQQALQDLTQQIDSMPDADREALSQQLQNLAQQLQHAADQQQQLAQQQQKQAEQALKDAGLTQDQIDQAQQQANNPQAVQQQLQQQGVSQQEAQRLAQQLNQAQRNNNTTNNGQQCANGLSDALQRMQQASQNSQGQTGQQDQGQQNQQSGQQQQQANQGGGQSFQQAAGGASDQLNQITRMREQLSQMQRAQSQAQNAMDQLAQGGGGQQADQQQQDSNGGDKKNQNAGSGGKKAGTGDGGNPLGEHQFAGPYNVTAEDNIQQGSGRIIASWMQQGPSYAGEPNVQYDQAVTDARQNAEKAVTEDRVPQRYHQNIRQYFDQIPESADQIQSPPPAPN